MKSLFFDDAALGCQFVLVCSSYFGTNLVQGFGLQLLQQVSPTCAGLQNMNISLVCWSKLIILVKSVLFYQEHSIYIYIYTWYVT